MDPSRAGRCQLQEGWNGCLSGTPSISSIITHFLELIFPTALGAELSPSYLMRRETQGRGGKRSTRETESLQRRRAGTPRPRPATETRRRTDSSVGRQGCWGPTGRLH